MNFQKSPTTLLFCFMLVVFYLESVSCSDFYSYTAKDISGKEISMSQYRGKVVLLVNVASDCGYTDQHYKQLVQLQSQFPQKHFTILAFPCNQFGQQEQKRNSAIHRFAKKTYNVNFPMFAKIKVVGEEAHPLYKFLQQVSSGTSPTWNFNKYLIDQEGNFKKYWDHLIPPVDCYNKIETTIKLMQGFDKDFETFRINGEL